MSRQGYGLPVRIPELPEHDRIEKAEAGEGWSAYVAFRNGKVVGMTVVPSNRARIPHRFEPRNVPIGRMRTQAVAAVEGLDPVAARAELRRQARSLHRPVIEWKKEGVYDDGATLSLQGKLSLRALYRTVAEFVLIAQQIDEPRYTYVRNALEDIVGIDLGSRPEARVKDYIRRATDEGFLAPAGSGRGPRRPGPELRKGTKRVSAITLHPDGTSSSTPARRTGGKR